MNHLIAPKQFPTEIDRATLEKVAMCGTAGIHESLLRSYHVLDLVKELLDKKVDHEVIIQIIELNYEQQS